MILAPCARAKRIGCEASEQTLAGAFEADRWSAQEASVSGDSLAPDARTEIIDDRGREPHQEVRPRRRPWTGSPSASRRARSWASSARTAPGKTTTMRILTCYLPPTEGTARVAGLRRLRGAARGQEAGRLPARRRRPSTRTWTVDDVPGLLRQDQGRPVGKDRKARIDDAIEKCRIGDVRDKLIGKLSKGYRQRVGLAQAILAQPRRAHPRRAHRRPRPQADHRDPRADQEPGRRPHRSSSPPTSCPRSR